MAIEPDQGSSITPTEQPVEKYFDTVAEYEREEIVQNSSAGFMDREVGGTGLQQWGQYVYEEFLPQLQWPQASAVFQEMADNDPTIGSIMFMAEHLIKKAGWSVKAGGETPADEEAAEFLQSCMDDMSSTWNEFICEALSMFTYGWSFHEVVYKVRRGPDQKDPRYRSKHSDGRVGWRKMPVRSQRTLYGWIFDPEDNGILAMEQQAPPDYRKVIIPLSKGLLFRTRRVRDNPEGRSLLRNAYRPWYYKKRIEEIEGIGIERDLAGLPVLTPPENVDIWDKENPRARTTRAVAERIVKNIRRDKAEGLVLPFGWELTLLTSGGKRQFDTNAIINRYDQRIAITMLADLVMLGADKVGSFALGEVKKSMMSAALESLIQNIADTINKYAVTKLFKYNSFPALTDLPQIVPGEVETPSLKELGDFFRATGMKIDDDYKLTNYVRRVASMPELTETEFKSMQEKRDQLRTQTMNASASTPMNNRGEENSENNRKEASEAE